MTITVDGEELKKYESNIKFWVHAREVAMFSLIDEANNNSPLKLHGGTFTRVSMVDWDRKNPIPRLY